MRFVVDHQLSPRLSKFLQDSGQDSVHVAMVGPEAADDRTVWEWSIRESRIVVSKDEDLFFLANRPGDTGRLVWGGANTRGTSCAEGSLRRREHAGHVTC